MLNVVVIGNGMVGHHYVEQLAASPIVARITVIGGETRPAYDRVHLSEYFAGRSPEDLALTRVHQSYLHLREVVQSVASEVRELLDAAWHA